jgi:hypothetical protein
LSRRAKELLDLSAKRDLQALQSLHRVIENQPPSIRFSHPDPRKRSSAPGRKGASQAASSQPKKEIITVKTMI